MSDLPRYHIETPERVDGMQLQPADDGPYCLWADVSARLQQPCPHCHLPRDLPAICTPEVNAAIEQGIAHDAALFNRGRDQGLAEQAAALAETRAALHHLQKEHGDLLARWDDRAVPDALVPQPPSEVPSTPSPVKE